MSETSSALSDNPSEALLLKMREAVHAAAAPGIPGEPVKAAIRRASMRLGLPYSRTRAHWYGEARSVPAAEWIAVQQARHALLHGERLRLENRLRELTAVLQETGGGYSGDNNGRRSGGTRGEAAGSAPAEAALAAALGGISRAA